MAMAMAAAAVVVSTKGHQGLVQEPLTRFGLSLFWKLLLPKSPLMLLASSAGWSRLRHLPMYSR
ncbi:hypothetical protein NC653_033698 [Populus alba x Populus x berolinensis]|uniref:Uncharacterized protein n=1 Tax=Populus alba x Populus x berolinensis TaxID=444605 RepID=A0AAD6PZG1_9ROSI|nr:hypothetical protein NC653_033698 [Populus alba x Populus x berolinensis]